MPIEPIGSARSHDGRDAASGDRMRGLRSGHTQYENREYSPTQTMTKHRLFFYYLIVASIGHLSAAENQLAIIDGGVQRSEDAPYVAKDFEFLPGEYVYFTFHIAGFTTKSNAANEVKSLALEYEITPRDANHVALTEPVKGTITGELSAEDKNWTPKRRASFLLPSFVAAGIFDIHVVARDLIAKTEATRDYPFRMGGVHVADSTAVQVQNFEFLRNQEDENALDVPAFAPGDAVWARFQMTGFKNGEGNTYKLSYGIKILRPDGKIFLDEPKAVQTSANSFYPAQYVPGELQITTPKNAARGAYALTLTIQDQVSGQSFEVKRSFTIE